MPAQCGADVAESLADASNLDRTPMPDDRTLQGGPSRQTGGGWAPFLIMAFAVLGLVGAFSVFAAQIPFQRALARSVTLDQALAVAGEPDAAAKLEALRPALDDSADRVIPHSGAPLTDMVQKVADERARMFADFGRQAEDIGTRLRLVIAVFTAACAVFGVAVLSIVRRAK